MAVISTQRTVRIIFCLFDKRDEYKNRMCVGYRMKEWDKMDRYLITKGIVW